MPTCVSSPSSIPISLKHSEYDYNENAKVDIDEDDIHLGEIEIGRVINGSVVTDVEVDAIDSEDQVEIRKWITLANGVILISTFIRKKRKDYDLFIFFPLWVERQFKNGHSQRKPKTAHVQERY